MYQVVIEKQVQKQLAKISAPYYQFVVDALKALSANPRPHGYKKLRQTGIPDTHRRLSNNLPYFSTGGCRHPPVEKSFIRQSQTA